MAELMAVIEKDTEDFAAEVAERYLLETRSELKLYIWTAIVLLY